MTTRLLAICLALAFSPVALAADELWGALDPAAWKAVPCVSGRPATEQDVKAGRAAFYVSGPPGTVRALTISLPHCAIWRDAEQGREVPVVCIQAEVSGEAQAVGFRPLTGGNGVCLLSELILLDGPDARFTR